MILMDGKKLAEKLKIFLKTEFSLIKQKTVLAIVQVGEHAVSQKFIEQKRKLGEELGVTTKLYSYPRTISGTELRKNISKIIHNKKISGVIVQLPLPKTLQTQDILNAVIPTKDVDMLSARSIGDCGVGKSKIVPPVVGAVQALFQEYKIDYSRKNVVIIGAGKLVGKPIADWFLRENVGFTLCTEKTTDLSFYTKNADIIISGVGIAKLISGTMVKDGVIVIDAGTSESEGKLTGDMDFYSVSQKAGFITPVPGGVGPLTVIMIYKNLLALVK